MLLSSNFMYFHDELGLLKTVDVFAEAGFQAIEFNLDLKEYYTDRHGEDFYREIRRYAEDKGICFLQAHAPFSSSYTDEGKTKQRFLDIVKSFRHAALLGAKAVIVHPCRHIDCSEAENYALMMEYNLRFYRSLLPYAEEQGVKIAIENVRDSITVTPEGLLTLLHALESDTFTVCYDVGHANKTGQDPAEMVRKLGKHIAYTHIHDNDGIHDSHTLPYYGTVDWEGVMQAFAEVGYAGNLNYEAGRFVQNTPIALRAESAKYMASVGRHLISRFEHYKSI